MHRLLPRLVRNRLDLDATLLGDAPRRGEALQRVDRSPHHVVRVGRAEALGEDVAHAGALEHGAHRAARDHVWDRAARERHLHHAAARGLDCLADRLAHLIRLARRDADPALPVSHGDERVEPEAPAALDDLGDAVDRDHVLDEAVAFTLPLAAVAPLAATTASAPPPTAPPTTAPPASAAPTT